MNAFVTIVKEPIPGKYFQTTKRIGWEDTVKVRNIISKEEKDIKLKDISLHENEIFIDKEWYKIMHMFSA